METFSALLALCEGNPPVTGGFSSQRPVTRSFEILFDLRLHTRLNKQSRNWWFGTPSLSWRPHRNVVVCLLASPGSQITSSFVNTLRPRQNGRRFSDDNFKCICLNENIWISIKFSLKFVPKGPINNIPALVQIMTWRRPGDKPLSEPMVVSLLTHICVTRPQWVKGCLRWIPPCPLHVVISATFLNTLSWNSKKAEIYYVSQDRFNRTGIKIFANILHSFKHRLSNWCNVNLTKYSLFLPLHEIIL